MASDSFKYSENIKFFGDVLNSKGFRCPEYGLKYNRDLNADINIVHALTKDIGWKSREPSELPDEVLRNVRMEGRSSSVR